MAVAGEAEKEQPLMREARTLTWCMATLVLLYVVGGSIFSWLERDAELESYARHRAFYDQMRDLYEFDKCGQAPFAGMEFCQKQQEFNGMLKRHFERSGTEVKDHEKWTFYGSAFYITTLVTTLGFGNLHPRTPGGQLFTVLFGLIGIPAMGYVLSHIGRYVVDVAIPACCLDIDTTNRRVVVLSGLMLTMILFGGVLFSSLEGWSMLQACYFSACTLMTIGFGDLLPGAHSFSRLATVAFIFMGLGVAASLIALLQIHVEIRGEHFAKHLDSWYDAVASGCGGGAAEEGLAATPGR